MTALYLQIVTVETSVRELKAHVLEVLASTKQPQDDVLAKLYQDATPEDIELYCMQDGAYKLLAATSTSTHRADDGTPLCSSCQLEDNSVIYVGFRTPGQDAPGLPVVKEPSLDDMEEEEEAADNIQTF